MKNIITNLNLAKKIEKLKKQKKDLQKQINEINNDLYTNYKKGYELNNIESVKIKFSDLLEELKNVDIFKINNVNLYALTFFYEEKSNLDENSDRMDFFGSNLIISCNNNKQYSYKIHLFSNFNEIQADGKTLFEHCSINGNDVIINKNIEDIICKFESTCFEDYYNDPLLGHAIFSCIEKGKIIEQETKEKTKKK